MTAKLLAAAVTLVLAMASPGAAAGPAAPRDDRPVVSLAKSRAVVDAGVRAPTVASRKLDRADDDDEDDGEGDDRDDEDEGDGDGDDEDEDGEDGDDGDDQTPPPDVPPVVTPPVVVPPVVVPPVVVPPGDGKPPTDTPPRPPSDPPVETPPPTEPPHPPTQTPPRPPGGARVVGDRTATRSCNALSSRRTAGTRASPRQRCIDARKKKASPARRRH